LDLALEVARIATAACAGFHVSVSIIDAAGLPKLYYVPDGTAGNHAQMGFRKAKAALAFKLPSGRVGEMAHSDSAVAAKLAQDPDMIGYAGGLPIMKGAEIIGAVGVSGAMPSTKDEECARSGLDQIRDRLQ
jgi:uncharacterized protein GlcG (DUF336 family)